MLTGGGGREREAHSWRLQWTTVLAKVCSFIGAMAGHQKKTGREQLRKVEEIVVLPTQQTH